MKTRLTQGMGIAVILSAILCSAAMAVEIQTQKVPVVAGVAQVDRYVRTADNFIILFDASGSMGQPYKDTGLTMVAAARQILKEANAQLPDLGWKAGLYLFTPWQPFYPIQAYDRQQFAAAIDRLPDAANAGNFKGQPTPLVEALEALDPILAGLGGHTVVFVFSDGSYKLPRSKRRPLEVVAALNAKYDVCFYLISTAGVGKDIQILERLAAVNPCSRVIPFDWLLGHPLRAAGALFSVKSQVFLAVTEQERVTGIRVSPITFEHDEANIRSADRARLAKLGAYLRDDPQADILVKGFADASGPRDYNLHLSRRRAFRVMQYLMDDFQIPRERIVVHWYGALNPIADNATAAGREQNRRVEVEVINPP